MNGLFHEDKHRACEEEAFSRFKTNWTQNHVVKQMKVNESKNLNGHFMLANRIIKIDRNIISGQNLQDNQVKRFGITINIPGKSCQKFPQAQYASKTQSQRALKIILILYTIL